MSAAVLGRTGGRRLLRIAAVVAALALPATVLGACIGGELGSQAATVTHEIDVHLGGDQPVALRHLTFQAGPTPDAMEASVTVRAIRQRDDGVYEAPPGVSVSVRPDDPTVLAIQSGQIDDPQPGVRLDFRQWCRTACQGGARVIVRADDPTVAAADVRIVATFRVVAPAPRASAIDADPRIAEDPGGSFDGIPMTITSSATPLVELTPANPTSRVTLRLHADREVADAARARHVVGSLVVRATGDDQTHALLDSAPAYVGFYSIGDRGGSLAFEGVRADLLDWLSACPADGACDVTVVVNLSYEQLSSAVRSRAAGDNRSAPPMPQAFRITLEATARLEAFDGKPLPADGLTTTATGGPG